MSEEKEHNVLVYMRSISLEVVIPEDHVWEFKTRFGRNFAPDADRGLNDFRHTDKEWFHPNGWHLKVTLNEEEEQKFYDFLRQFSKDKNLTFKEPRNQEAPHRCTCRGGEHYGGGTRLGTPDC